MPGKHWSQVVENQVKWQVGLAHEGEDGKEPGCKGQCLEEGGGNGDDGGKT